MLEAQEAPKSSPRREKSDVKKQPLSASILEGPGPRFGGVFGRFFGRKIGENRKSMIFAKTSGLVVLLW